MKKTIVILLILVTGCHFLSAQTHKSWLIEKYKRYSTFTDPGEYAYMYKTIPDSLPEILKLIKSQLIHPIADLPKYSNEIPKERSWEDLKYPTVNSILKGLKEYNPQGLVYERKPADRLVVSCRYHAILLASILKYKGIPVRVRYGFANYLFPGHHIYHVICEIWVENEKRWILVDPDRQIIGLSSQQFEMAFDAWKNYRQGKSDPSIYGVPGWWGAHPVLDVLCHDLASVLGNEYIYFDRPSISADSTMNVKQMSAADIILMDKISDLLADVDTNYKELDSLYIRNKQLQFQNAD